MNIYRFDSDRNDDNKYTRAMYFDMLELQTKTSGAGIKYRIPTTEVSRLPQNRKNEIKRLFNLTSICLVFRG